MTITAIRPDVQAPITAARDSRTDRPTGLTREESHAYVRGYAKGCMAYVRKHGGASIVTAPGQTVDRDALHAMTRAHETDRHPTAHRAGIAAIRAYRKRNGIPEPVVTPPATVTRKAPARKAPARKLAAVAAPVTEPVTVPEETVPTVATVAVTAPMTRAARKASNRELAATMRAAGIAITTETWAAAKASA